MTSQRFYLGAVTLLLGIFYLSFYLPRREEKKLDISDVRKVVSEAIKLHAEDEKFARDLEKEEEKSRARHRAAADNSGGRQFLLKYAKLFNNGILPDNVDPNQPSTITTWWQAAAMIDWYLNAPPRHECGNLVLMGETEGNWKVCQQYPHLVKPPCLVYSFGIANDFSFDDTMGKMGCEVHSFDPSMNTESYRRSDNVSFWNIGLGNANLDAFDPRHDMYVKDKQSWKIRTLKSLKKQLGHENRVIDVLKMDVEGYEWGVVENFLETNVLPLVRNFMLEWHIFPKFPARGEYVHMFQIFTQLREMGFREYYRYPHKANNQREATFNLQGESEMVNVNFR